MVERETFGTLLIVGLGLLGGSAAMAARSAGIAQRVVALCRPGHPHDEARAAGVIDDYGDNLDALAREADLVLLCQPVDAIRQLLPGMMAAAKAGALVTDVGSTKGTLVTAAEAVTETRAHFVGSHPMAGSHLTGWKNGRPELFSGATTYITVTDRTHLPSVGRAARFWRALGSRVVLTTPNRHDHMVALLSHVPHMAAAALVGHLEASGEDPALMKLLAGNGLRDTTRIAQGSAVVWREICQHNAVEISAQLRQIAARLQATAAAIEAGELDRVEGDLARAAELRGRL